MTGPEHDDDLGRLLEDAVSDVEPTDRLATIRARTARRARQGWYAAGAAALVAASVVVAVVVAVAVVATGDDDRPEVAGTSTPPTATSEPTDAAVDPPAETTPVYYVGPGGDGPSAPDAALYRYFEPAGDPLDLLMSEPSDPDYRTLWPAGSLLSYRVGADSVVVEVAEPATSELAMHQLALTMQAVTDTRLPVLQSHFSIDSAPVTRSAALGSLAHVSISDPGERYGYAGSFTARGIGTGFEGTVACALVDGTGAEPWSGATIAGTQGRFEEWTLDVDLAGLSEGSYLFTCRTDDPTGGAEGIGAFTDTRTIVVRGLPEATDAAGAQPVPVVYYVGDGPDGPDGPGAPESVLYPERAADDVDPLALLTRTPRDPDYSTRWPAGSLASYDVEPGRVVVRVTGGPVDDDLARQQLIWTLASGPAADLPVELEWSDGRDTPIRPVERAPDLEVLSHLSITDPVEGASYDGAFTATGLSNGFEASVACFLYVGDDGGAYGPFVGQAEGWLEERLYPWEVRVELARERVPPGSYTLQCATDDPTGGAEGSGAAVDTRTITVE